MKKRFGNGSVSVRARQVLGVAILACAVPQTAMATPVTSAYLDLSNCGDLIQTNPTSVAGSNSNGGVTTGVCGLTGPVASGAANFSDGISLDITSIPQRGPNAVASLDDYLTFHVGGGGSAVVNVTMSGGWNGTFNDATNAYFQVEFDLGLGPTLYQGKGYSNLAYDDGNLASHAFTGSNPGPGVVLGSYLFNRTWTISDGVQYEFFSGLKAYASGGASAHIDDPLIITLPPGVTFTSLSGSTYAPAETGPSTVPEPASLLLLGTGLVAAAARRRSKRTCRPTS